MTASRTPMGGFGRVQKVVDIPNRPGAEAQRHIQRVEPQNSQAYTAAARSLCVGTDLLTSLCRPFIAFATSRAHAMKRSTSGRSVRPFNLTTKAGGCGMGKSTGSSLRE